MSSCMLHEDNAELRMVFVRIYSKSTLLALIVVHSREYDVDLIGTLHHVSSKHYYRQEAAAQGFPFRSNGCLSLRNVGDDGN